MKSIIHEYIRKAVAYTEDNMAEVINLDGIARELFLSRFHLDRLFTAVTGKSLMRYAAGRKLARSLDELLHTDLRVIDVARTYGFRYEQSYIRAFKREFGITPDKFRKTKCELAITEKIDFNNLMAMGENAVITAPKVIVKPSFFVAGRQCRVKYDTDVSAFAMDSYHNYLPGIPNAVNPHIYYGHCRYDRYFNDYTACIETVDGAPPPEGMVSFNIPTHKYLVFTYTGLHPITEINYPRFTPVEKIAEKWFDMAGLKIFDVYHFEKVDVRLCKEDYCELDLYYPC